jgi:hypothetical protein
MADGLGHATGLPGRQVEALDQGEEPEEPSDGSGDGGV